MQEMTGKCGNVNAFIRIQFTYVLIQHACVVCSSERSWLPTMHAAMMKELCHAKAQMAPSKLMRDNTYSMNRS